jgi:hypothetical protein
MKLIIFVILFMSASALADEFGDQDRDPAAVNLTSASRRTYAGGVDEEDLQVQPRLPEATLKADYRSIQKGVYKQLFNQELKDSATEAVEE